MNKAEFAVCRIKEKLPGNRGFLTKGSGCVVHCETLTTSWGWKCHHFIVTPSVVLCREDLSSDKTFVVEFLSKDKRGLETFEVKQMAEDCKDLVGRSFDGDFVHDHNLTFLSVEPLDKRGFLKKMVKKGSLQTFRPLDCVDSRSKFEEESLMNEGLFCHVIDNLFSESTNLPFSTQTFKLVYESQTRQFNLQDFGGTAIKFSQVKPPIGSVILTKKGEFAGVVNFVDDCTVSPVFLPEAEPSMTDSSQEDRRWSCDGVNIKAEAMANDEKYLTEHNEEEKTHPESDVLCDENSHAVKCSIDHESHYNNNASLSPESFLPHGELTYSAKSEPCVIDGGSGIGIFQQDQGCADSFISGATYETDEVQTENVLDSVNGTTNLKSIFEKHPEEDNSTFPVIEEEAPDKVEGAERSIIPSSETGKPFFAAKATNINNSNEVEQTAGSNITRDDSSLVTVIQVGEMKPVKMEATEQVDPSNDKIGVPDGLLCSTGEVVSSENEGSNAAKEHTDIREAVIECLPANEDGEMTLTSKDDSVGDEETLATDDSNLCITENEPVALAGSMPEDKSNETDSIQKRNTHVGTETNVRNLQGDGATLVTQDNKDLTDSSAGIFNALLENSEVSIYVTPPNGDDVNHAEVGDNLKESHSFQEDVSEDLYQQNSPAEVSLTTETTDEMAGEEIRDSQSNVDNDISLSGTESTQVSGVDVSLNLEQVDSEENTEVMSKDLDEHIEAEPGQYSPRCDGDKVVITQEFSNLADEAFVPTEICENSDHNQNELDTAESPDLTGEEEADKCPIEDSLSSNVATLEKEVDGQDARTIPESDADETEGVEKEACLNSIEDTASSNVVALEKRINGQDIRTVLEPASDVKQADAVDQEVSGVSSLDDALVLQRVDADSLLTETVINNPPILSDLGKCLDTEYQHGRVPCWRDLAELLDIPLEAYEHCGTFSATSPTEDLFAFLAATKPQLTIEDIQEALQEIDRHEVVQLLDRKIAGGIISKESVVGSLVERDDTDILGRMALKLDRKSKNDWKRLALQLSVPQRVLRNFGSHQRHNSSLMLLKYIPIFDPELTLEHLKGCLISIGKQDAVEVLENAGISGDEPVKDILDDSDLLDQMTDLLNEDPPAPHWRHLAKELKIPQEKCKIFEPTEDSHSPTKLLFKSIENWEPDLTFEELVLALVAMKRHDVLSVLQKYFSSDDVDQILEENNLLAPMEDHPDENES